MATKIFIDPGHGGSDSGATGNGLREKDLTLTIALKIRNILNAEYSGHTIRMSRTTDQTITLRQRTDMANAWNADYLLSVHINAGGGTGYEDYIYNKLSDSSRTAKLRDTIHAEIVKKIGNVTNRGKKKANFHMLRESHMPAMLTENLFIDRKEDADRLKSETFLNQLARGHAVGLAKALGLTGKSSNNQSEREEPAVPEQDVNQVSDWAQEAVDRAVELGITDGSRMGDVATREEVVVMVMRAFFLNS